MPTDGVGEGDDAGAAPPTTPAASSEPALQDEVKQLRGLVEQLLSAGTKPAASAGGAQDCTPEPDTVEGTASARERTISARKFAPSIMDEVRDFTVGADIERAGIDSSDVLEKLADAVEKGSAEEELGPLEDAKRHAEVLETLRERLDQDVERVRTRRRVRPVARLRRCPVRQRPSR